MKKTIYLFGNQDLEMDSLPIRLIPELQKEFPETDFVVLDPNEEWNVPEEMIIIDTVVGIKEITVFEDLEHFDAAPKLTCHDFDAFFNLRILKKLGKLRKIKIIGVPPHAVLETTTKSVTEKLRCNI